MMLFVQGGATAAASPGALLLQQSWAPAAALLAKVKRATCAPGKCSGLPARHPPYRAAYTERREGGEKTVAQVLRALSLARAHKPPWVCVSEPPSTSWAHSRGRGLASESVAVQA